LCAQQPQPSTDAPEEFWGRCTDSNDSRLGTFREVMRFGPVFCDRSRHRLAHLLATCQQMPAGSEPLLTACDYHSVILRRKVTATWQQQRSIHDCSLCRSSPSSCSALAAAARVPGSAPSSPMHIASTSSTR